MDSEIVNNAADLRYETHVEGHTAFAAYKLHGEVITFTHTIVPEELGGRGIASRLIKFALDDVRAQGLKVIAQCPFVAAYIEKHPDYRDLLV
ncbi:GNAT family N-acetyltransferase [Sphingomonas sp. AOB5]|uniref:GNAT family N-acetyltransferase n=1 Tax=Sphingomonas sp. AOB5 TaxID=3034017 RepID=UPI0023F64FF3|nr:GNAT family N-acetyltransferase [Sphingomonas sp. AOB5]MDF7777862.1 GNAT family N-acetyltransferase [Sphingomonas sp. AOB5]